MLLLSTKRLRRDQLFFRYMTEYITQSPRQKDGRARGGVLSDAILRCPRNICFKKKKRMFDVTRSFRCCAALRAYFFCETYSHYESENKTRVMVPPTSARAKLPTDSKMSSAYGAISPQSNENGSLYIYSSTTFEQLRGDL